MWPANSEPWRVTGTAEDPLEVTAQRSGYLLDAITAAYRTIGLDAAAEGDEVFAGLATARILQPGSNCDSIRVLAESSGREAAEPGPIWLCFPL